MPQEILRQVNFNGGELSPQAVGRRDLKAYVSSLALAENLMTMAEGPIRRRPGLKHVDRIRNRLETVSLSGATYATPNGGDGEDLGGAGLVTTEPVEAADPYVIVEIDFGEAVEVGLVDLTDFALFESGGAPGDPAPPQLPWWKDPLNNPELMP